MSHPSLFPKTIPTSANPTRTMQFARQLNVLIEMREANTLNAEEFRTLLRDLGVPAETAWFLELAIAGGLDVSKRAELSHEYEVCDECRSVDGQHWADCQQIS